jgi:hypothetical protein
MLEVLKEVASRYDDVTYEQLREAELDGRISFTLDVNLKQFIDRAAHKVHLGVCLDVDHVSELFSKTKFDDVAAQLDFFNLNPADVDPTWPSVQREGPPLVDVDQLKECWNETCGYSGQWTALLNAGQVLELGRQRVLDDYTVLKAGATITIHDFANGATSTLCTLLQDVEVDLCELYDDGNYRYGIQRTCGLVQDVWNGELAKKETDR